MQMGCASRSPNWMRFTANLWVRCTWKAKAEGRAIAGADTAALIDEIPVLAAIAPYTEQGIEVRDAKELRVKESDRIVSIVINLRAMGAQVEEREDGLKIPGGQTLRGANWIPSAITASPWPSASPPCAPKARRSCEAASAPQSPTPSSFLTLEGLVER
jgi:5-enolpyruvylshikimate-3-phosphate synthase